MNYFLFENKATKIFILWGKLLQIEEIMSAGKIVWKDILYSFFCRNAANMCLPAQGPQSG